MARIAVDVGFILGRLWGDRDRYAATFIADKFRWLRDRGLSPSRRLCCLASLIMIFQLFCGVTS